MTALVFTVAQNGYAGAYADCLRSQRAYADRIGATYVAVTRPWRVPQPALAAWLKMPLLAGALDGGYEWVAFIDSDARVREDAPDYRTVGGRPGHVHMARGRSGRLNSGVVFAQRGGGSRQFMSALLGSITEDVPEDDRRHLKYENGNVIRVARETGMVEELPLSWNNTHDPELHDHIRHFTGPLRAEHTRSALSERVFRFRRSLVSTPSSQPVRRDEGFRSDLDALTVHCQRRDPRLVTPPG